jgi:hypothetical protein
MANCHIGYQFNGIMSDGRNDACFRELEVVQVQRGISFPNRHILEVAYRPSIYHHQLCSPMTVYVNI